MNNQATYHKDQKVQLRAIKELSKEITSSKRKAENFLRSSGILDFVEKNTKKSKPVSSKK